MTDAVLAVASDVRVESPETARRLDLALREAQLASAQQRDSAQHLWHDAVRAAMESKRAALRRHADLQARWELARAEAATALAGVDGHVERLGRRRSATAHALARADFAAAERLAASGHLTEAIALAQRSISESMGLDAQHESLMARFADKAERAQWRRWVDETIEESRKRRSTALVVDKLGATLLLYRSGKLDRTFPIELGSRGYERKLFSGDQATPEGRYRVTQVKKRPNTIYYKALLIDYPNAEDRRRWEQARREGRIPRHVGIGNLIEIHGDGGQGRNWTQGCVALTNEDLDSFWNLVSVGMAVTIVGTL